MVKNWPVKAGDVGSIPGWGRFPGVGNGDPLQDFGLENPMDKGAWWAVVPGTESDTTEKLSMCMYTYTHTHTEKYKNPRYIAYNFYKVNKSV